VIARAGVRPGDPVDKAIAALSASQRGHVARWQLLALGLDDNATKYRLRSGRLHRVYPGVYAVGHRRTAPIDRSSAAVLACGPGAVLSRLSAAALWGFVKHWDEPFEVIVPGDRRPQSIRVHKSKALANRDKTHHHGIPVTTPARTALDCAKRLEGRKWTRFINEAFNSNYLKEAALGELLERHPKHPASGRLTPYTEEGKGRTRSELEDAFVEFIERFGLPMPELNVPMGGRILDAFYREEGLIVEVDSYQFHKTRDVFEDDREKDADAIANRLETIRITDRRMKGKGAEEADRLEGILRGRRRGT
jgi:hypothetical protein